MPKQHVTDIWYLKACCTAAVFARPKMERKIIEIFKYKCLA